MAMEVDSAATAATSAKPRYTYEPPWPMYSLAWSAQPPIRMAVGSYLESEANKIQVLEVNEETQKLESVAEADHPFPSTKLMWRPTAPEAGANFEMLASTSTTLNLWKYDSEGGLVQLSKLANARTKAVGGHSPPLTSFDWSAVSPHKIGASSVDSTCTIWNLERQKIETQLIAHDKAVHDIVFSTKDTLFASVGADGSVRLFDQRNLDHSTIIYEAPTASPLLRLAWNRINSNLIATIGLDNPGVILIDIRRPSVALLALSKHDMCINSVAWAPHSRNHLLCGTDDGCALIWDVAENASSVDSSKPKKDKDPVVWHDCDHEVYQAVWPTSSPDHIGLGMSKRVDIVQL